MVAHILKSEPHPEQGYRARLGLFSLAKQYGEARLEAAAARTHTSGTMSYRSIRSVLQQGLDQIPPEPEGAQHHVLRRSRHRRADMS